MAPTQAIATAKGGGGGSHQTWRGQAKIPGWAIALIVLFGFMLIAFICMFFYFLRNGMSPPPSPPSPSVTHPECSGLVDND